jgi:hypothetical protein
MQFMLYVYVNTSVVECGHIKNVTVPYNGRQRARFFSPNVNKPLQNVTLDILIQFGVLVCSIRVSVPRRAKEGDCV